MNNEQMDLQPFFIEFLFEGKNIIAEIKPCCQEENVFYYDIWFNNRYEFTVTPGASEYGFNWRVALVNADKKIDPLLAEVIGQQIEKHIIN